MLRPLGLLIAGRMVVAVDLAKAASVGISTVLRLEGARDQVRGSTEVLWKIQTALEQTEAEFIPADDTKGPGVRLKQRQR